MATINASDILDQRPLPIDSRDICTKVTLVVAGRPSGREADITNVALGQLSSYNPKTGIGAVDYINATHYPRPIVYEYEHSEHETYGAHKVFALPPDCYPFLPPTDESIPDPETSALSSDVLFIRDGDPETGFNANLSGNYPFWIEYAMDSADDYPRIVGWRLMYWMEFITTVNKPPHIQFSTSSGHLEFPESGFADVLTRLMWNVPATHDGAEVVIADMWATCHADARQAVSDAIIRDKLSWRRLSGETGQMYWRLIHFYPLILDENYLEELARANIRLPASKPERITVRGVVPLESTHEVDGTELTVARQTYQDGVTIIDFEQAGSPVGVASEAFEAERVRLIREQTARASSLYPLTMGER